VSGQASSTFLERLSPAARARLSQAGTPRHYRAGEMVFLAGDPATFVVLIEQGLAKVTAQAPDGAETVLSLRGPGDLVGEMAAVEDEPDPRTASVWALEPIRCRVVHGAEFRRVLTEQPEIAVELLRMVALRVHAAGRRLVEFGALDTTRRVARLLAELATQGDAPGNRPHDVKLSQDDLAGFVGASRESVVRALAVLRTLGLVSTGRRRVAVTDIEGLRTFGG
jgi:CRP-like cAMP-binding protein